MIFNETMHGFDLIIGTPNRRRATGAVVMRVNPNGEELRRDTAATHTHSVKMSIREFTIDVNRFVNQPLRRVGVHVYDNVIRVYARGGIIIRSRVGIVRRR